MEVLLDHLRRLPDWQRRAAGQERAVRFTGFLNGDQRQIKDWQEYGATYFFGGSYRF